MWRILVVDDEPDVRSMIRMTLEPNYECVEANDGLDALEKLPRYEPDFVLMDVMMPLMDGFDACRAIRKHHRFHDLPVMFLTALTSREDIKTGYGAGANLYLTKPFEPSRLLKNVDVFFQTTPPPRRPKRYTLAQLKEMEASEQEPPRPTPADLAPPSVPASSSVPASLATSEPEQTPAPEPSKLLPRVMVVDDDADILALMDACLEGSAEVVHASDGLQAIERLVKYQPDILIIDIMLPKMSGYQLVQSLRSNRSFARLPILICSAKSHDRDVKTAQRLGANGYLKKPFTPPELTRNVEDMMALPDFRVRPKTYTLDQIRLMESSEERSDVFRNEEDDKPADASQSRRTIGKFLRSEGKKDAFNRDEGEEKKRRLFGFGKK